MNRGALGLATAAFIVTAGTSSAQPPIPHLEIEAPDALAAAANQVRGFDPNRLESIITLTGLTEAGPPIRVRLVPEDSGIARDTPFWVAAFADARRDLVVLFPARIGPYPHRSLEAVLHHEVAHVLAARAAGGHPLPRWFNEGLASAAERGWNLETRSRFVWEMLAGRPVTPAELEGLFEAEPPHVTRAYVLADRLVRDLLETHGGDVAARILFAMSQGTPFEVALYQITGSSVDIVVRGFWQRHAVWESWIGFAGHPFTQWVLITSLALVAIWRHRRRRAARRRRWELEEREEEQAWEEHRRRYRVH